MKARTDKEIISVFQGLHENLTTRGLKPNYMWLDNKAQPEFQDLQKEKSIDYQLDPQVMYHINSKERNTSTFKDRFITGIWSTYTDFPMKNWDQLLEQAEITLKFLRPSRLNPRLLA